MINITEKFTQNFISDVIDGENCNSVSIISSEKVTYLIKFLNMKNIKEVFIHPFLSKDLNIQSDLYIFIDNGKTDISEIGKVKNLLSQKIVYIQSNDNKSIDKVDLIKLGFEKEFEHGEIDLNFYAYNLKTYNNKRDWNNPKGWANPENFDKFRW